MGIPKFYRWTSERYPCLSEIIKEYQIPEFDNLYLDMNGIIHNCSHPNDEDVHLRIPEEHIFKDIFRYIEFLFKMIKPCKVFFMAIDGVAPRAKMNQQRGRRFRSARIAEEQEAEAVSKGEKLPSEERFDSNCITPGTQFMARLHEQLQYFVKVKVSTDPLWQRAGLVIYLSGHDVPGEGEHKIMDFLRHIRSKPDYNPATRHCLYGLDADLVMLGLSTHELQFSLLREEVKFSRAKKPKKGVKRPPPKQNSGTASYDLTNVSIFTCENNPITGVDSILLPPQTSLINPLSSMVKEGTTFAEALEISKSQTVTVVPEPKLINSKADNNQDEAPPSVDDSGAKGSYKAPLPEKTTFLLLHLSLMRDYIDFEFQDLKETLKLQGSLEYNLEKLIDDWILMNILVGNDFVPHLPHLHIVKGALPMLYRIYMEVLPTLDGYLNENGILNLRRFEVFIKKLSQFDIEMFRETYDDMKYMESKTGKNIVLGEKMFELENFDFEDENFKEETLESSSALSPELAALAQRTEEEVFGEQINGPGKLCVDLFSNDDDYFDDEDSQELKMEFLQYKRNYYIDKLHVEEISTQFLEMYCKEFIRAIQWVLLYYYKGVSSWGWFYPFHYSPFASDLKNFADFSIEFDYGQPFRPFEQLLAVLPSQSRKLLPQCYQWLMTDKVSPIYEFYPEKFEQDLNGKKQDWEAVVLIPFIDESKLLEVMEIEELKLSKEELHRNSRGLMMCFSYNEEDTGLVKAPRDMFPALTTSHVKTEGIKEMTYNPQLLPKGIHPKAKLDAMYQGFPTLKSKPVEYMVEKAEIKVFEFVTREESMVISLEKFSDNFTNAESLAKKLIGKSVWVNWPHLTYAYVTGILTRQGKFIEAPGQIIKDPTLVESRAEKEFDSIAKGLISRHLKFKGIKLGRLNVIVYAKMMEGRKVRCDTKGDVCFQTQWSRLEQPFALKTCVYEENVTEIFYLDRTLAKSYLELFKTGDQVFYLGDKLFGSLGTVVGHEESQSSVVVYFEVPSGGSNEANLKNLIGRQELKSNDYFSSYVAAGKCQISSYILSRITGTVFISVEKETKAQRKAQARKAAKGKKLMELVTLESSSLSDSSSEEEFPALETKKLNVGLDLKFNKKNLEVRGYTSKRDGQWFYSGKAIQLVNDFVMRFSDFVHALTRYEKGVDCYNASELFPVDPLGRVNEMIDWLETRGIRDLPKIPTNTNLLDDDDIDSVWKYVLRNKSCTKKPTIKKWSVRPNLLLKPGLDRGCVTPVSNSRFDMLDRVICVDRGAPIHVGHRGTVVGIQNPVATEPEQIEESFKSTGAATMMTLIVLVDPTPGVFDKPEEFGLFNQDPVEKLSGDLASILGVKKGTQGKEISTIENTKTFSEPKPRLIKLYPYQAINLSQGSSIVKEGFRITKQVNQMNVGNGLLPVSRENDVKLLNNPIRPKKLLEFEPDRIKPVRILTRQANYPVQESENKRPYKVVYNSKLAHESKGSGNIVQSSSKNSSTPINQQQNQTGDKLPWPPQPLTLTPLEQLFSAAAFAQQQQKSLDKNIPQNSQNWNKNEVSQKKKQLVNQVSNNHTSGNNGQIFSSTTAFQQVNSLSLSQDQTNVKSQKTNNEGGNIMQMLSKANEQYESRDKRNKRSQDHKKIIEKSEKRVSHYQQHNEQRHDNMRSMDYVGFNNHQMPPVPPSNWLPQKQHFNQAIPIPQYHTNSSYNSGFRGPNSINYNQMQQMFYHPPPPQNTFFVPTQVYRSQAHSSSPKLPQTQINKDVGMSKATNTNYSSGNQTLPVAVIQTPTQSLEQMQSKSEVNGQPRKSKIAANFSGAFS